MSPVAPAAPVRVQRKNVLGWKQPANTVYVGQGTKWATPYRVGRTQVRMPAIDGADWEREGRIGKPSGQQHAFVHPGSTYEKPIITFHQVEDATAEQCVEMYQAYVTGAPVPGSPDRLRYRHDPMVEQIRAELAGKNLACWCPLTDGGGKHLPCHADVLLEIANGPQVNQ